MTTLEHQDGNDKYSKKHKKKSKKNKDLKKSEGERKDLADADCYSCGLKGHYANKCPYKMEKTKKAESEDEEDEEYSTSGHVTWAETDQYCTFSTYQVNAVSDSQFKSTEVLIENQADISIVHPMLRNIMAAEQEVKINGVGGHQFTERETGYLDPFFPVYASTQTKTNILSFAQVEDQYPITYTPQEAFTVHLPKGDIVFKRRDGMYVADWEGYKNVFSTTVCTKAEQEHAKIAYELARTSGYLFVNELIHLVEDGNIVGLPSITREDILHAYDLFGVPTAYVRGKMMKRPIKRAVIDDSLVMQENSNQP